MFGKNGKIYWLTLYLYLVLSLFNFMLKQVAAVEMFSPTGSRDTISAIWLNYRRAFGDNSNLADYQLNVT